MTSVVALALMELWSLTAFLRLLSSVLEYWLLRFVEDELLEHLHLLLLLLYREFHLLRQFIGLVLWRCTLLGVLMISA